MLWKINSVAKGGGYKAVLKGGKFSTNLYFSRQESDILLNIRKSFNGCILNKSTVRVWVGGPDPRR